MRGLIKYGMVATLLAGAGVASATSLPGFSSSGVLQSGNAHSAQCQTSNVSVAYTPNSTGVWLSSITIGNIDANCGGKYVTVSTIRPNGSVDGTDHALVPAGGGAVTLSSYPGEYINDSNYNSNGNTPANQVDHVIVTFSDNAPA
ncbi:MAG: hypothetical protein ACRDP1_06495 [Nocardioidaceae bacterium]